MSEIKNTEIADPSDLSFYPTKDTSETVIRDSLLATIEHHVASGEKVVIVSGDDGMGKTVLLSQFVNRNKSDCIAIFLDVVNKQSYFEDNIIRDLYLQTVFYINGVSPDNVENIGMKELLEKYYSLSLFLRKEKRKVSFIVDGLGDIPKSDQFVLQKIIDALPLSYPDISVILSSSNNALENVLKKRTHMNIQMVLFSDHETSLLLPMVSIDMIQKINHVYRGVPEKLQAIKRMVEKGVPVDEILQNYSDHTASLHQAEWESVQDLIDSHTSFFGLVTFAINPLSIKNISKILEIESNEIEYFVKAAGFLELADGKILFRSNGLRDYAKTRMKDVESKSLVTLLAATPNTDESVDALSDRTGYYARLGKHTEIVEQLSNENIRKYFVSTSSINQVIKQIKIGKESARTLGDEIELLRLGQAQSILAAISTSKVHKSELLCYLKDNDYESAVGLTSIPMAIEEKLQLLAVIASFQKTNLNRVDESIEHMIYSSIDSIDPEHIGVDRTVKIATELFPAYPEISLSLINRMESLEPGGGNKADYAFFMLSLSALQRSEEAVDTLLAKSDSVEQKKKDAIKILSLFKKDTPAEKVIAKIDSFDSNSDAILILKSWLNSHPEAPGAFKLIEKLLSLVLATTDYHANATLYSDLVPVLNILNKSECLKIIEKIEPKLEALKDTGPTIEYVNLQLGIVALRNKHNKAGESVNDLLAYIHHDINDQAVKLSALILVLRNCGASLSTKAKADMFAEIDAIFNFLLSSIAEQEVILKSAIISMAEVDLDKAITWSQRLNTRLRRDLILSQVIVEACSLENLTSIDYLSENIRRIKDKDHKNDAILALFERALLEDGISKADFKRLVKLRNRVKNSFILCSLDISLIKLCSLAQTDTENQKELCKSHLLESWNSIDGDWHKIDIAFDIHNSLLECDRVLALEYRKRATDLRLSASAQSEDMVESYVYIIDLTMRAMWFLTPHNLVDEDSIKVVISLIKSIPSPILRIKQFSRLASIFHRRNMTQHFDDIVSSELIGNLESLGGKYSKELAVGLYLCSPILYCHNRDYFERMLEKIREDEALLDMILNATQRYLLYKSLLNDPFEAVAKPKFKISSRELEDHLYLIKRMKQDHSIYNAFAKIVDSVYSGIKAHNYSHSQIQNLIAEAESIVANNFNHPDNLQHEGYKICLTALILKLSGEKNMSEWKKLIDQVDKVPVISDRVIVLGELLEAMPSKFLPKKKELFSKAIEITDELPSFLEKISRYEYLVKQGKSIDPISVKQFVRRAIAVSAHENDENYQTKRLSFLDSVFSMDEEFAQGLSVAVDHDPARKRIIDENIQRKQKEKEERKTFDFSNSDIGEFTPTKKYQKMFWKFLGELNADNHAVGKNTNLTELLHNLSNHQVNDSYPMLSYYIHSIGRGSGTRQQAETNLVPIFRVLLSSAAMFSKLFEFEAHQGGGVSAADNQFLFEKSDSEEVINHIKSWIVSLDQLSELTIIDPYFELNDLVLIARVIDKDPNVLIKILTCHSRYEEISPNDDGENAIRLFWQENICSNSVPYVQIVFCGLATDLRIPIHDRWWLAGKSGLRFGGSMNGVTGSKISSISAMSYEEVLPIESKVDGFLTQKQRDYHGTRVLYKAVFT